jgi:hypothetical protein
MNSIVWPEKYTPGTTDNFVSNEVIGKGLTAAEVWTYLNDTSYWKSYYKNVSKIGFDGGAGPTLSPNLDFRFTTFVFPVLAHGSEYVPPTPRQPGNRVRVLTQESQIGQPGKEMAVAKPNPMLNAHQDWLDGLVRTAREKRNSK